MTITFLSKTAKKRSLLVDALRILAWEEYRAVNKESLKDLSYGGYEVFEAEWKVHEIHQYTYAEIVAFAESLEFAENDLLNLRSNYYAKKSNMPRSSNSNGSNGSASSQISSQTLPETVTQLNSESGNSSDSGNSGESKPLPKYDEAPF
ncbi:hypothetical protein [Microcoleus asticus]|uniref:Uncharacterized protein n=1 Tax=Microcoleus asticus IPMA8 TaxID=2563858 RepID=A0ABX2D8J2_9CYAN|nr:hypothetical protein [Microcoleus asticus]NQE38143.1 hypothetical protein [Microcoleus asticus IPMA8]